MSDNVSQLQPQKKPGLGKRIAAFVLLAVLVAGGVAAYVFRDQLNLDALQRYVRYLNVSDDSKSGRFLYDESNSNQYAGLSGGLAVASATGLSLYDKDGTETASIQAAMSVPFSRPAIRSPWPTTPAGPCWRLPARRRAPSCMSPRSARSSTPISPRTTASAISPRSPDINPSSRL